MRTSRIFATLLATSIAGCAQDANVTAVCNGVFSQGIRDVQSIYSRLEIANTYKSRLCDIKSTSYDSFQSSASSLGLDLPLAEGLIGLKGDTSSKSSQFQAAYSKFCSASYFDQEYKNRYDEYTSTINGALLASWNQCQQLHLKAYVETHNGIYAYIDNPDFDNFTVRVQANPPGGGGIAIKSLNPDLQVRCTRGGIDVMPGTVIQENIFTLSCRKDADRAVQFSLDTALGSTQQIRLPARTSKILELENRITELSTLLKFTNDALSKQAASTTQQIGDLRKEIPNAVVSKDAPASDTHPLRIAAGKREGRGCGPDLAITTVGLEPDSRDGAAQLQLTCAGLQLVRR